MIDSLMMMRDVEMDSGRLYYAWDREPSLCHSSLCLEVYARLVYLRVGVRVINWSYSGNG